MAMILSCLIIIAYLLVMRLFVRRVVCRRLSLTHEQGQAVLLVTRKIFNDPPKSKPQRIPALQRVDSERSAIEGLKKGGRLRITTASGVSYLGFHRGDAATLSAQVDALNHAISTKQPLQLDIGDEGNTILMIWLGGIITAITLMILTRTGEEPPILNQ